MEPRGSPDYRGKPLILPLLDPFAGYDKAPPQIALNWRSRRDPSLYRAISADDFPSTAFYLSKANYLEVTAKHVSKEDALVELANHYHLSLEEVLTMETTSTTSLCSKSRYQGRYGQRSTRSERGSDCRDKDQQ